MSAEFRQKSHRYCVFRKFVQKSFRQKIPRDLRLLTSFVKAGRCAFLSTDFSSFLLIHIFFAIFYRILLLHIDSCFVLGMWVDGAKFRCKRKSQRQLWAGIGSASIYKDSKGREIRTCKGLNAL